MKRNISESSASIGLTITSPGRDRKGLLSPSQRLKSNENISVKLADFSSRSITMRKLMEINKRSVAIGKDESVSIPNLRDLGGKSTSRAVGNSQNRLLLTRNFAKLSPRESTRDLIAGEIVPIDRKIKPVTEYRFSRSRVIKLSPAK